VRIALDAMGSDLGAVELVSGAVLAADESSTEITVIGDEKEIRSALKSSGGAHSITVVPASQVVTMDDSPFEAVRKKTDSSMVLAFELLKKGEVDAVVSAGNSGAVMASAIKFLGRLKNVSRPGSAGIFPTLKGHVVVMDVGANVDCRPKHLYQFGVMASAFSRIIFGVENPKVGLLSIGEEGSKGNTLVKGAR
jgi:glycerol-3-phosphate acyltransferase PlsX